MGTKKRTDLLTYRALVLLGEQEHKVGYHAPGDQELDGEDGVNLPDEAAPDTLVPKVEASVGLENNYDEPFLFLSYYFKPVPPRGWSPRFRQPWPLLEKQHSDKRFYCSFLQKIILIVLKDAIVKWLRNKQGQRAAGDVSHSCLAGQVSGSNLQTRLSTPHS